MLLCCILQYVKMDIRGNVAYALNVAPNLGKLVYEEIGSPDKWNIM